MLLQVTLVHMGLESWILKFCFEELVDFGRAHFFGVTFVVEEDVFLSPKDVGVAGAGGVVFEVDDVAILVEEFFLFWRIWLRHFIAFFEVAGL